MFSQKRRFYEKKSFYLALVAAFAAVTAFGLWFDGAFEGQEGIDDPAVSQSVDQPQIQDQAVTANRNPSTSDPDSQYVPNDGNDGGFQAEDAESYSTGYLVIEEDGYVRIYSVEAQGERKMVRTSEISFDLLSQEDQQMFQQGIHVNTEDELMELLQDFES